MRLWPSNWWPRTLGAQLVAVTAAAVLLSNVGVASWFQFVQSRATETAINDRLIDRAISAATLLAAHSKRVRVRIGETLLRVVTACAGDRSVHRELRAEEQLLPQRKPAERVIRIQRQQLPQLR